MKSFLAIILILINIIVLGINYAFILLERNNNIKEIQTYIYCIDIFSIIFIFLLFISFLLERNECCNNEFCNVETIWNFFRFCLEPDCGGNWINPRDDICEQLIGIILLIIIFVILYMISLTIYLISKLIIFIGKHYLRIISVIVLNILQIFLGIIILNAEIKFNSKIIAGISFLGALCNLLGFILPLFIEKLNFEFIQPENPEINNINVNGELEPFIQESKEDNNDKVEDLRLPVVNYPSPDA